MLFWAFVVISFTLATVIKRDYGIYAILVLACFPGAAVISIGDNAFSAGVSPYYVFSSIFMLYIIMRLPRKLRIKLSIQDIVLFSCIFLVLIGAVVLPIMFSGIGVYSARVGIDSQIIYQTPLRLTPSQIGQCVYLLINCCVYYIISKSKINLRFGFDLSIYVAAIIMIWQLFSKYTPIIFPENILSNNPNYSYASNVSLYGFPRINGSFLEPSTAAGYFSAMLAFSLAVFFKRKSVLSFIKIFGLTFLTVVTLSSTGIVMIVLVVLVFSIFLVYKFFIKNRLDAALLFVAAILLLLFKYSSELGGLINNFVFNRIGGQSFNNRGLSNIYSSNLVHITYGLGVGLGSNRPSSFLMYILSNMGVVPSLMFMGLIIERLWNGRHNIFFWPLLSYLIAKILSLPDLNDPWLWILLGAVSSVSNEEKLRRRADRIEQGNSIGSRYD